MTSSASLGSRLRQAPRTLGAVALLQLPLPAHLVLTAVALLRTDVRPSPPTNAAMPKTVLISGGKMTKALQLARSFQQAGHRVVLVESAKYRLTGHRFSRAVSAFHTLPPPGPGYTEALLEVVRGEGIDVYVPVCAPASSFWDSEAKAALEAAGCEVVHADPEQLHTLDDKHAFSQACEQLGLAVPESYRITDPQQVVELSLPVETFVLKSIAYDPVRRMDLTLLPRPTRAETVAFVRDLPITPQTPWILQEYLRGREFCSHGTVRKGALTMYACCQSSAVQLNYVAVDKPQIKAWVERFVAGMPGLTGQASFDFLETSDGEVLAIECNPRTHSAVTMFAGDPRVAAAFLEDGTPLVEPLLGYRPTYWFYNEVWRVLSRPSRLAERLRVVLAGRDAIFAWDDPMPFLMVHHVHLPWLLLRNLYDGKGWLRIDLNIGKLVEPGGD